MEIEISHPEIRRIARAAFPSYNGRKCSLEVSERCTISNRYWDGGTRSEWIAVDLASGAARGFEDLALLNPSEIGGARTDPIVTLPESAVLVEWITFCGKDLGLRIHAAPGVINPAALPARVELSPDELSVLRAFSDLKSGSYRQEALASVTDSAAVISWLIARKLLKCNKVGAQIQITDEGRNARNAVRP
jgi:hypothetical protein